MKKQFKPGARALVVGKHPHAGKVATLLSHGPYGLDVLGLVGWLCRADDGSEFYCKDGAGNLAPLPTSADEQAGDVLEPEVIEEEALVPTVSPGKRETTLDRLRAHYRAREGEAVLLTPHQTAVLRRLEACWATLLDSKLNEKAVEMLMNQFKVSRAQAYRDVRDTKLLFGDVVQSDRVAERYILREMAMHIYVKAKKAGELGEMNKAVANLIKITGIEHDDPNVPTEEQLAPSTYLLEIAGTGGQPLRLNLEKVAELPAEEYEVVMDAIQHSGITEVQMLKKIQEAARGVVE